jgi:hypothetical protein
VDPEARGRSFEAQHALLGSGIRGFAGVHVRHNDGLAALRYEHRVGNALQDDQLPAQVDPDEVVHSAIGYSRTVARTPFVSALLNRM